MERTLRYPVACAVGTVASLVVTVETNSPGLLAAVFAVYAVSAAVVLRYPVLTRGSSEATLPAGLYGGGVTAGAFVLGDAAGDGSGFAVAVFGLGLATFGLAMGYWIADSDGARTLSSVRE